MLKYILLFSVFISMAIHSFSQAPLPDFTIKKGTQNQKVISWQNNYGDMISVLNIQRSTDSVRDFRTVYSEPNPSLAVNAFTDTRSVPGMDYYRIYYQMKNGSYYFSKAKKVSTGFISEDLFSSLGSSKNVLIQGDESRVVSVVNFKKITDSVITNTSDSIYFLSDSTVNYRKFNPVTSMSAVVTPTQTLIPVSGYLFLNTNGSVVIRLPDNEVDGFSMTIYQLDGTSVLYKIQHFDNPEIILSKSSFLRAGFYPYELFEDGKLKERSKFQIK